MSDDQNSGQASFSRREFVASGFALALPIALMLAGFRRESPAPVAAERQLRATAKPPARGVLLRTWEPRQADRNEGSTAQYAVAARRQSLNGSTLMGSRLRAATP
jgi:hypothetical protein